MPSTESSSLHALLRSAFQNWAPMAPGNGGSYGPQQPPPPPPAFRKTSSLDGEPFEVTNWKSDHRLELPFDDDDQNPVARWQLHCEDSDCLGGAYMYSPDYTQNVQDEPLPLMTLMDHYRLQDLDCSTDGVLTPFCNYCLKLEAVRMCGQQFCSPSVNHFSIRTTCPHPKFLTEHDGQVSWRPSSGSSEQYWRLSQSLPRPPATEPPSGPGSAGSDGAAGFDFL